MKSLAQTTNVNMDHLADELDKIEMKIQSLMMANPRANPKSAFVPMKKIKEILAKLINESAKLLAEKPFGSGE